MDGVRDAIISVPLNRPNDQEKQDRTVAKAILDNMGFEKEKYRLGYTKVLSQTYLSLSYPKIIPCHTKKYPYLHVGS